jgi:hypothetical protein
MTAICALRPQSRVDVNRALRVATADLFKLQDEVVARLASA